MRSHRYRAVILTCEFDLRYLMEKTVIATKSLQADTHGATLRSHTRTAVSVNIYGCSDHSTSPRICVFYLRVNKRYSISELEAGKV